MPPASLSLKIIKDAAVERVEGPAAAAVQLRLLDMAMLPFTIYLRLDLPIQDGQSQPVFLHLIGRPPALVGANTSFTALRLPDPAPTQGPPPGRRRILLVLIGHDIADGRYRLAVVQDRTHLAFADILKRPDQVRVLTRQTPVRPREVSPVLISGTHKSGTTWLERVIDAHRDFIVLHEANTFNLFDVAEMRRMVAARQAHFSGRDYIRWLNPAFDVADFSRFLQISLAKELMLRLGRAWGARYVADRTPGYSGLYAHLSRFWEGLRIVHIVRHPLDVLASRLYHEANLARGERGADDGAPMLHRLNAHIDQGAVLAPGTIISDREAAGKSVAALLLGWRRDQENYLAASRVSPAVLHLIKYEALLADFAGEAARMFDFIGTDPARTDIAAIAGATSFAALSGGRVGGESDPRSFFRKGIAGDWRNVFSPAQAHTLWRQVADTASTFGYTLD